jgi:hypothetical protein
VPKHMGGGNEPSNILKVNVAMHAFLHKLLWEEHGLWQDYCAWQALSGHIGQEEAIRYAQRMGQLGKSKSEHVRQAVVESNRRRGGVNHHFYGKKHSLESREKMAAARRGKSPTNKGVPKEKFSCSRCDKLVGGLHNLRQHEASHK